jgi:hypothetical protein
MMHVIDAVLDSFTKLFRHHRYSPLEKLCSVLCSLFRELKNRTKRFYNNVNAKTLKSIEELVTAIAIMHNISRA